MVSMWEDEPDIEELRRLHALLSTDPRQALPGLRALSDRGSVMSMLYIASAYRDGTGTTVDRAQAEEWYRRASDAGSALGSYELGKMHFDAREFGKAQEAFSIGATRDFAPSMHMLAMLYLRGHGVPADALRARDLLERAVAQGHVFSKRNLGALLMRGQFGALQAARGLLLFLRAFGDAVIFNFKDRHSDRLR